MRTPHFSDQPEARARGDRRFRYEGPTGDDLPGGRFGGPRGRGHRGGFGGPGGFPDDDSFASGGPRGRGRGGFGPGGFGPGGPGGPFGGPGGRGGPGFGPGGRGRGPRGRGRARGDVRAAILLLLDEQPRHGYELIQEIAERSQGAWTPSPGSIYPTLQALADEGLVAIEAVEGRRTASLTDEGTAHVAEHRERLGTPWTSVGTDHGPALALRQELLALKDATAQVARVGTPAQHTAAAEALTTARKALYRLLAEDTPEA